MKNIISQYRPVLQRMYMVISIYGKETGEPLFEDQLQNVVKDEYAKNGE
jgi:hypothetical protein